MLRTAVTISALIACGIAASLQPSDSRNYVEIDGKNYFFSQGLFSSVVWYDARISCADKGMQLLTLDTKEKTDFFVQYLNNSELDSWKWTSGRRDVFDTEFIWETTGQKFTETSWGVGEPDNTDQVPTCVAFSGKAGAWADFDCAPHTSDYICEEIIVN